jgi:hypothetical protein
MGAPRVPRILSPDEVIEWHPLSGKPAPEYIPPRWDGPHVGKRLAEAMRTLRHMPINGVPAGFVASWPEYSVEWEDRLAQAGSDQEQQRQEAAVRNWTKTIPSSLEISRMEISISWPARYLSELPQLLRTVGAVAGAKSRGQNIAAAERKLRLPGRIARKWNNEGLDMIAAGLQRDAVRIF